MASVYTQIANLWVPAIWEQGLREAIINTPALLNSPIVATSPMLTEIASGPGTSANIPFIIEPNPADQLQHERTAPDVTALGSGLQACVILNRVSPLGATALAAQLSGIDPVAQITQLLAGIRYRQRQTALIAQLTGIFDLASTPNSDTGAYKGLRLDNFAENNGSATSSNLVDSSMLIDGAALMGRAIEKLVGGVIVMHTQIQAALLKQGQIDVIRNWEGEIVLRQWKGLTVVTDDSLVRAGATNGKVYYTILAAPGSIAMGEKPQVVTQVPGEVAAVQLDLTQIATNDVVLYDRTRYILHPQGAKWVGTPADPYAGPSNAELATVGNWALALSDVRNSGTVVVRTNG